MEYYILVADIEPVHEDGGSPQRPLHLRGNAAAPGSQVKFTKVQPIFGQNVASGTSSSDRKAGACGVALSYSLSHVTPTHSHAVDTYLRNSL